MELKVRPFPEIRQMVWLAVAIVLSAAITWFVNDYRAAKAAAAVGENRGVVLENTSGGVADGVAADLDAQARAAAAAGGRAGYRKQTQEDRNNEPETAARDASVVPASRLRAFRARRLARERPGCAGGECETAGDADATRQR